MDENRFGRTFEQFRGDEQYREMYAKLGTFRNRFMACPEHWDVLCKQRVDEISGVLEAARPEDLQAHAKQECHELLLQKKVREFSYCVMQYKRKKIVEVHTQILRQSQLIERLNS